MTAAVLVTVQNGTREPGGTETVITQTQMACTSVALTRLSVKALTGGTGTGSGTRSRLLR